MDEMSEPMDGDGGSIMTSSDRNRRVIIMGAGREGRIAAEDCTVLGLEIAGFLDDTKSRDERINGIPVLGGFELVDDSCMIKEFEWIVSCMIKEFEWIVALGNNQVRRDLLTNIQERGGRVATLIHPTCLISPSARIGKGVRIGQYASVLPDTRIADFALFERYASIGADVVIGEGAFVGPGCQIAGACHIGCCTFIGIGASLIEGVRVGDHSIVGAGAAVTTNIPEHVLAVGVPARVKKSLSR